MIPPRRRLVVALLAAAGLPSSAFAQPKKGGRIGFLSGSSAGVSGPLVEAFRGGLADVGQGHVPVDFRWADGHAERLPALAKELVGAKPMVIVAHGNAAAAALKAATGDVPIVMVAVDDPVRAGFAKGLRRPGTNMTGIAGTSVETTARQLELIRQIAPKSKVFAVVLNPKNSANELAFQLLDAEAKKAGLRAVRAPVSAAGELGKAFAAMKKDKAQGIIVLDDPAFAVAREQLAKAAAGSRLPAVYAQRELAEAGGLASYGASGPAMFRRAAAHTVRILNGFKVAEVAIEQSATSELVVNMKTARALKIAVPKDLLAKADRVIE
jgi:putative tryptophan/tyrosine transport system substrate-binding protein